MKDYIIFNTIDSKYKNKKSLLFEKEFDNKLKNDIEKNTYFENML
jgi:hypothetical protein